MTIWQPGDQVTVLLGDGRELDCTIISNDLVVLPSFVLVRDNQTQEVNNVYRNQVHAKQTNQSKI